MANRLSDEELETMREVITSKLGWVPQGDPFGPRAMLEDGARMLATVDYWRTAFEHEAERYRMLDECDRVPLLAKVAELSARLEALMSTHLYWERKADREEDRAVAAEGAIARVRALAEYSSMGIHPRLIMDALDASPVVKGQP